MTRPFPDPRWRREFPDGRSILAVEYTLDGRVEFAVDDEDRPGFRATVSAETAREIAAFLGGAGGQ